MNMSVDSPPAVRFLYPPLRWRLALLALAVTTLVLGAAGCSGNLRGAPQSALTTKSTPAAQAADAERQRAWPEFADLVDETDTAERNKLIDLYLMEIDSRYEVFVSALNLNKTRMDLGSGIGAIALGLAGTLTDSVRAKTNYASAAALLAGSTTAIAKTVFLEKTVSALVASMDAGRSEVRLLIRRGMSEDIATYRASDAWRDLLAYERAGSLLGAISYVQSTSQAIADKNNSAELREICALSAEQVSDKRCLTRSLASSNPKLNKNTLDATALALALTTAERGDGSNEALTLALQSRIRHACQKELAEISAAFQKTGLYANCPNP